MATLKRHKNSRTQRSDPGSVSISRPMIRIAPSRGGCDSSRSGHPWTGVYHRDFHWLFLGGLPGAFIATLGIFLPAFLFVAISGPLVPRMRQSPVVAAFLDGVVVALMGLMAVVTWQLARSALVDWFTFLLAAVSAVLLMRLKVNSAWLVLGGAVIGLIIGH